MGESDLTNSLANDMRHLSCRPDARKTVAIICSENTKTKAEKLNVGNSIQDSQCSNFKREIIVCKDLGCFSDELLNRCQKFYILVDSSLMAIVMSKRNFHSEVDEFFESVEKNGKKVLVCRDLGPNENDDAIDFYARLPRKCRLWYNKVELNFMGSSNSTSEDGGNDVQLEEKEKVKEEKLDEEKAKEEKLDEEKVKEEKLDEEKAKEEKVKEEKLDEEKVKEEKLDEEKVKEEKLDEEKVKEEKLDEEKVKEEKLDEKEEEKWDEEEETTAITSEDPGGGRCVQVGSHLTMKVTSTSSKPLKIEQYGDNNAVSIKIGPKVKNNVRFVVNSEQLSNEDEEALTTDLKEDECLRISVKSSGCTSLSITKGSIIIEMDVEPGTNMDKEWLFSLFTLLFEERLRKLFPEGISLDVEVEKTWTVTLQEIESAKKSDLHALCVPKEKYDALFEENTKLIGKIKAMEKMVVRRHQMSFPFKQYEELLKENLELSRISKETILWVDPWSLHRRSYGELLKEILELSRKMRETIFEDYQRSLQYKKYGELLKENLELSRKMRETIFEDDTWSLQREKYGELLRENRELSRKMRETIFEDYPRSHQREKDVELLGENLELSREMRETIFEDYLRSLQGEKYEDLLRENLELNSKLREAAFEYLPWNLQRENYGLLRENLEQSREMRETILEDYPRSLQYKKYEQCLKKSIELSRKMRETIFEDYPSLPSEKYEVLLDEDLEWSTTFEGLEKSRTGSVDVEEEFPKKGIRAEEKKNVTERPWSVKRPERPGRKQTINKGKFHLNFDRTAYIDRIPDSIIHATPPLAEKTAFKESKMEGASTKGGQDLPSQSK